MAELTALIFDVDGTLAETERDGHRVAFNQAFAAAGFDWHWSVERYGELLSVSGGKERIRYFIEQYNPTLPYLASITQDELIVELHIAKSRYFNQLIGQNPISPRPGVKRLIAEARTAGVRLAIASTAALPNVLALLRKSFAPEAPSWFEIIAAGDTVPYKKPAPDIYEYVKAKMELNPAQCMVIEDTAHGLQAATKANFPTVVTINDYTKHQDFTAASLVVSHLGEPNQPLQVMAGNCPYDYLDLAAVTQLLPLNPRNLLSLSDYQLQHFKSR